MNLSLHPNYGEYPLIQPHTRSGVDPYLGWAVKEAKAADSRHGDGLKDRVKQILLAADERRMGMVENITVIPRPAALLPITQLLDFVSPNLRSLEILAPVSHIFEEEFAPDPYDTLDVRLSGAMISFPSLTHIRIDKGAIQYTDFITDLLSQTPNLLRLEADLKSQYVSHGLDGLPEFDICPAPTRLRYLQLTFGDVEVDRDSHPVYTVLCASPHLREVSLRYTGSSDELKQLFSPSSVLRKICEIYICRCLSKTCALASWGEHRSKLSAG